MRTRQRTVRGAIGVVGLLVAIELFTRSGVVNPEYLPAPSTVVASMWSLLTDIAFLEHLRSTVVAVVVGLAISCVVGVVFGILLGSYDGAYRATNSLIEFLRPIPTSAIIPVAILLFGQQMGMKIFLICFSAIWPILFNTLYGVHDVDKVAKDSARAYGIGAVGILTRVVLQAASPQIYGGIRIAASIALIVSVGAEIITSAGSGIGTFIMRVQSGGTQYDLVFAATAIAGLLGWLMNWALVRGEKRIFSWNPDMRAEMER